MLLDRAKDALAGFLDPFLFAAAAADLDSGLPKSLQASFAARAEVKDMTRRDGPHLPEDRTRGEHVAEAEEVVNAALVDVEFVTRDVAQRGNFRGEGEPALLLRHEQGLDAQWIAREAQRPGLPV